MPKGQKTIIWTAENDNLLLKGILVYGNIQLTPEAAEQIAKLLGPNVLKSAVQNHIMKLRSEFRTNNRAPATTALPANGKRPATSDAPRAMKKVKTTVKKENNSDTPIVNDEVETPATPPKTPAGKNSSTHTSKNVTPTPVDKSRSSSQASVVSKRCSPRSATRIDYSKLHDPAMGMGEAMDEDGEQIFENQDYSSEDSADVDEAFTDDNTELQGELI
ncbi:hypothetical protein MMC11_001140 [Xylographa trunciseda]|nr:hypothetical protein [Xylographa trunciseda]